MTHSSDSAPLADRHALVTGASRGIGREIARLLSRAGAAVTIGYHLRESDARAVRDAIRGDGGRAAVVQADVSRPGDIDRMIADARHAQGPIDILINNAAIAVPAGIDVVTDRHWKDAIDTNLTSSFLATQAVLPDMRAKRWGRLIFLSSVAAQVGGVVGPHYAASKAGLHGLMHYYAAHLAKEGITANVVAPALIETEMVTSNPNARKDIIPVGRFGTPDEAASVVLALVENAYVTGQVVNVNGGWYST